MRPRVAGARRRRESLMEDVATVTRPGPADTGTLDPITLKIVDPASVEVHSGPCHGGSKQSRFPAGHRLQHRLSSEGAEMVALRLWSVRFPWDAPEFALGDQVVFTAVGPDGDPELLTKTFTVTAIGGGSYLTARELELEDVAYRPPWPT